MYSDTKRWVSTQCHYSGQVYQSTALISLLLKVITGLFINHKLSFYFNSRNKNQGCFHNLHSQCLHCVFFFSGEHKECSELSFQLSQQRILDSIFKTADHWLPSHFVSLCQDYYFIIMHVFISWCYKSSCLNLRFACFLFFFFLLQVFALQQATMLLFTGSNVPL